MSITSNIPVFELFGETSGFPDVLHCERIRDRASEHGWIISPHRHSRMSQLFLIEKGEADALLDTQALTFKADTFLYIPPHCVHSFSFAADTEGYVLTFPVDIIKSLGPVSQDAIQSLSNVIEGRTSQALKDLIHLFAQRYNHKGVFRSQVTIGLAHATLAIVAEVGHEPQSNSTDNKRGHIQQLDSLIAEHQARGWGAGDYAQALSISTGHLSRICRASQGVSASTYIESATMNEAARLLAFTQMSVADVGYKLGFADPSYFSRRFKTVRAQTPSQYRLQFLDNA